MGTRGCFGVRVNGEDKTSYNHFDSYPDGLGNDVLKDLKALLDEGGHKMRSLAEVPLLNTKTPPTEEQKKRFEPYADLTVSEKSLDDWYCLTRNLQGEFRKSLELGAFPDKGGFLADSLYCEWAYLVNLDTDELEVYRGFNKDPNAPGRYAALQAPGMKGKNFGSKEEPYEYYGVRLVKSYPFAELPDSLEPLDRDEDDDEQAA